MVAFSTNMHKNIKTWCARRTASEIRPSAQKFLRANFGDCVQPLGHVHFFPNKTLCNKRWLLYLVIPCLWPILTPRGSFIVFRFSADMFQKKVRWLKNKAWVTALPLLVVRCLLFSVCLHWVTATLVRQVLLYCVGFPCTPFSMLHTNTTLLDDPNSRQMYKTLSNIKLQKPPVPQLNSFKFTWHFVPDNSHLTILVTCHIPYPMNRYSQSTSKVAILENVLGFLRCSDIVLELIHKNCPGSLGCIFILITCALHYFAATSSQYPGIGPSWSSWIRPMFALAQPNRVQHSSTYNTTDGGLRLAPQFREEGCTFWWYKKRWWLKKLWSNPLKPLSRTCAQRCCTKEIFNGSLALITPHFLVSTIN